MKVQGHIIVRRKAKDGNNGNDGVSYNIITSQNPISCSAAGIPKNTSVSISLYVKKGTEVARIASGTYIQVTLGGSGLGRIYKSYSGTITFSLLLDALLLSYAKSVHVTASEVDYGKTDIADFNIPIICDGVKGDDGIQGCIIRQSEWAEGIEYRNDESLTSGTRYLDIAIVTTGANTFNAYKCLKTHTSSSSIPVSNTTYWQKFNTLQPVYTPLIMAQNAILRFMQGNQLLIMKSDNKTVAAGLVGGDYPFWVGATTPGKAPFKVSITGIMTAEGAIVKNSLLQNVKITGTVRQPWSRSGIYINVGSDEKMAFDNIAAGASGGWGDGSINSMITWTTADNGRIMRIANWKFDGETFDGSVDISAPSGKYFFEDGISKSKIALSREVVELMGYGDSSNFYGYIVLNRINFMTTSKYGRKLNVLAQGRVTGTNSGASIVYKTFDGSEMSVSRGNEGRYTVYFSSSWGLTSDNSIIMLTGYGYSYGSDAPLKATLVAMYGSSFLVHTSDDATRNDGSFMFQVINLNDWV